MSNISDDQAREQYGAVTDHEKMPNGEVRLRFRSNGSAYIKTIQAGSGAWQKSHLHRTLVETYVVQMGWMALVQAVDERIDTTLHLPGDIVSTKPGVPHAVYLSSDAVIHTIKHGGEADWIGCDRLDAIVSGWSETDVRERAKAPASALPIEHKYAAYASIYNHLDNLIWLVPGFVLTVGLSAFGLVVELASRTPRESAPMLGALLLALAVFFVLGGYSVMRLRHHHTLMGGELKHIEGDGYFERRAQSLRSRYLPSAPHLFMSMFFFMAAVLFVAAVLLVAAWGPFLDLFTALPGQSQ